MNTRLHVNDTSLVFDFDVKNGTGLEIIFMDESISFLDYEEIGKLRDFLIQLPHEKEETNKD